MSYNNEDPTYYFGSRFGSGSLKGVAEGLRFV